MTRSTRRTVLTGLLTGVRYAVKSFEPSLMPRSAIDQGLVTAGSFLSGFVTGTALGASASIAPFVSSPSAVRVTTASAVAIRGLTGAGSRRSGPDASHHPANAWAEAGSDALGSLGVAGVVTTDGSSVPSTLAIAAVGVANASDLNLAISWRDDRPDLAYVATAGGVAAGANAAVGAVAGVVALGARVPRLFTASPMARRLLAVPSAVATAGVIAAGVVAAGRAAVRKIEAGNAATEVAFADPPPQTTVSGSSFSLAAFPTLGLQGRRLVSSVTTDDTISEVMETQPVAEPVRVYVGVATAATDEERVELAVQELRRAGAFERSTIIAASPAGTGYVNYIAVEAAELMSLGDVATVAIQYGGLPSMLSIARVGHASSLYGALLKRLREEIDQLGRPIRLVAYGESLGALTSQNGVALASEPGDLIVDAALWVGTPQGSKLFASLVDEGVPVFDRFEQYEAFVSSRGIRPSTTLLNHDNDPVTKFTPAIAWRMPEWLRHTDRGRGTNPHQRWLPGVAFWQALVDTKNAATVVPGEFYSTGHDYRADLARFVKAAFGFDAVNEAQLERIEERLRASEIARAEQIAQGRVPAP